LVQGIVFSKVLLHFCVAVLSHPDSQILHPLKSSIAVLPTACTNFPEKVCAAFCILGICE